MIDANIAVVILSAFKHTFMGGIQGKTGVGMSFSKKKNKKMFMMFLFSLKKASLITLSYCKSTHNASSNHYRRR